MAHGQSNTTNPKMTNAKQVIELVTPTAQAVAQAKVRVNNRNPIKRGKRLNKKKQKLKISDTLSDRKKPKKHG